MNASSGRLSAASATNAIPKAGAVMAVASSSHIASESDHIRAELNRLAALTASDYEAERKSAAKRLGWRPNFLDEQVGELRKPISAPVMSRQVPFEGVEPWPDCVDGAALLTELVNTILRFCVLPDYTPEIVAAWILHAWAHDAADISPILVFSSPEKRCGKTTALSVVAALTPRPLHSVNVSTAVVFRVIEKHRPTLLIDEADTFLAANDELRGILNGGHNRLSAWAWRVTGDNHEPTAFNVWTPKAIAMIGKVPDTIEDRAVVVQLRRKAKGETVERFRAARVADFLPIRQRCARWAKDHDLRLRHADPAVPNALHDRAQDNARALCAIADACGGEWPKRLREALLGNAAAVQDDEPQSIGAILLRDIADIFASATADRLGSADLAAKLAGLEDAPWGEWRQGQPVTPRSIKKLLAPYRIAPRRDRFGAFYHRSDFADALERYAPSGDLENPSHPSHLSHRHASVTENRNDINDVCRDDACDGISAVTELDGHEDDLEPVNPAIGDGNCGRAATYLSEWRSEADDFANSKAW
jgi:hypothetical protein